MKSKVATKAKPKAPIKAVSPKKTEKPTKKAAAPVQAATATKGGKKGGSGETTGKTRRGREPVQICRVIGCNAPATTAGYSRTCYIKYWKQIKQKEEILREGTLVRFLKELVDKYPEKVLFAIQNDLASEEAYAQMIRELDLYGGIDELEHEPPAAVEEEAQDAGIDDIKKDITKEEDIF